MLSGQALYIPLHGKVFYVEKFTVLYENAKVNNIESVKRNIKKRKKSILITFKPLSGRSSFKKYYKYEGISLAE